MTTLNKIFIEEENRIVAVKNRLAKLVSTLEDQDYLLETLYDQMPDSEEKLVLEFFKDEILSLLEKLDGALAVWATSYQN